MYIQNFKVVTYFHSFMFFSVNMVAHNVLASFIKPFSFFIKTSVLYITFLCLYSKSGEVFLLHLPLSISPSFRLKIFNLGASMTFGQFSSLYNFSTSTDGLKSNNKHGYQYYLQQFTFYYSFCHAKTCYNIL